MTLLRIFRVAGTVTIGFALLTIVWTILPTEALVHHRPDSIASIDRSTSSMLQRHLFRSLVGTNPRSGARVVLRASDDEGTNAVSEPKGENDNDNRGGFMGNNNNLLKDTQDLAVGDWVVAKRDIPSLGIRAGAVYQLQAIFLKGSSSGGGNFSAGEDTANNNSLGIEIRPLERLYGDDLDEANELMGSSSYTKYLRVYNPRDHDRMNEGSGPKGVVVTPEEIGLVSLKADWTEATLLAVPGLFWVVVAVTFSNYYTDRYGGNFLDALFRT